MIIRKGGPQDFNTLVEIWLRSVRETHTFLSEENIQNLLPVVKEKALPSLEIWILCNDNGDLMGFMGLEKSKLEALFFDPKYTGVGGGKLLIQHARKLKGPLTVDVNEQNPEALKFYKKCGFHVVGRSEHDSGGRPFPLLHMAEK